MAHLSPPNLRLYATEETTTCSNPPHPATRHDASGAGTAGFKMSFLQEDEGFAPGSPPPPDGSGAGSCHSPPRGSSVSSASSSDLPDLVATTT